LVGGDAATLARCSDVLDSMGAIHHVGPSGAGATIKLANNAAVMSTLVALGHGLALTDGSGVDPDVVLDAIGSGPLASFVERFRPKLSATPDRVDFRLALARKDLALARDESQALGLDPTQLAATIAVCDAAIEAGFGDMDNTSVVAFLRSIA
jgi:3-hydroxyisobutyrate dehydrogenase